MLSALLLLAAQAQQPDTVHFTVDGVDRTAYIFAPSKKSEGKPPVLFMFHGHGGSAERCMGKFHLEKAWPEAIVVYGDGLEVSGGVHATGGKGWMVEPNDQNRDIRFFDAMLAGVVKDYNADPRNVFAAGFSNGGGFTYTLWTARADKITAFCPSGAAFFTDDTVLKLAKPAFVTISTDDEIVPTQYQKAALEEVKKINQSEASASPYGAEGVLHKGKQPTVVWTYKGGHEFPFQSYGELVKFFKSVMK